MFDAGDGATTMRNGSDTNAARWPRGARALLMASLLALAGAGHAGDLALRPGEVREASLAAGAQETYVLDLGAGEAIDVFVEQRDAALVLRATPAHADNALVQQTDAGRGARLAWTLTAEAPTRWRLHVGARKTDVAASYRLELGPVRPRTAADSEHAAAQALEARADALRRTADKAARPQVRQLFADAASHAGAAADGCLLRRIHTGAGRLEAAAGNYAPARDQARLALAQACADDDRAERAQAEKLLGMALGYLGQFEAAAAAGERALDLYRGTGDLHYQGVMLGNLSAIYRELGRTGQALDGAQAALALAGRNGDALGIVFAHESIAAIHLARGELAAALRAYRATLDALRTTPYPMIEGQAWNDLGIVYRRLGDAAAADDAYARAMQVWTREDIRSGHAETLLNRADALLEDNRPAAAQAMFAQALALSRREDLASAQSHALRGLGQTMLAQQRPDAASTRLLAARDLARSSSEPGAEAAAEQALGDVAVARGDTTAAQASYRRALALAERSGDEMQQALAWAALAHARRDAGDLSGAHDAIAHALDRVERQRIGIDDPRLRTRYFAGQRAWYGFAVDVLMQRDAAAPGHGDAAAALEIAERARARSLQDALAERALDLDADIDPALRHEERQREDDLRALAWRLARTEAADADARTALQRDIDAATRTLDAVRGRIRAAHPRYAELLRPAAPDLGAIQRDLFDPSVAVLVYWLGDERSYLWVVRRDALEAHVLPPRTTIEQAVAALRKTLLQRIATDNTTPMEGLAARDAAAQADIVERTAALGRMLLDPARDALQGREAVVIGDGALQLLPFALLDAAADATPRSIVYLPSFGALRGLRATSPASTTSDAIAVFADPVFGADDARLAGTGAPAPTLVSQADPVLLRATTQAGIAALPRLPNARAEAEAIAALAGASATRLALDFDANRDAVLDAPRGRYGILHFATHALLNADHPELSGIVLSLYDAQGRARDGFLRGNDLHRLDLRADLVVLSVCDSAFGDSVGPEGVFSLARAFFQTGTRRVVASLWPVDDRASARFMQHFYVALLRDHRSPQQALAAAQAALRAEPAWSAPFYWAGFVLQGDWR